MTNIHIASIKLGMRDDSSKMNHIVSLGPGVRQDDDAYTGDNGE